MNEVLVGIGIVLAVLAGAVVAAGLIIVLVGAYVGVRHTWREAQAVKNSTSIIESKEAD